MALASSRLHGKALFDKAAQVTDIAVLQKDVKVTCRLECPVEGDYIWVTHPQLPQDLDLLSN